MKHNFQKLALILMMGATPLFMACSGNAKQTASEGQTETEAEAEAPLEDETNTSPTTLSKPLEGDLAIYGLTGHVSWMDSHVEGEGSVVWEFDRNKRMTLMYGNYTAELFDSASIKRDESGRLLYAESSKYQETFAYVYDRLGRLVKDTYTHENEKSETVWEYKGDARYAYRIHGKSNVGGTVQTWDDTYTYSDFDEFGNWRRAEVKRKNGETMVYKRQYLYYQNHLLH